MAWELLTEGLRDSEGALWATVFGGDAQLEADEEALAIWRDEIGMPEQRILRLRRDRKLLAHG